MMPKHFTKNNLIARTTKIKKSTLTKEQEQMWTIISDSYGDQAWKMLEDMHKNGKINYRKVDKYFQFIMDYWPDDEVLRTVRTWLRNTPMIYDSKKLKTFQEFTRRYGDLVVDRKWDSAPWPKPKDFDTI